MTDSDSEWQKQRCQCVRHNRGVIGINSGLWLSTKNEDELAGVIAHEIAHVTQNHIERFAEKRKAGTVLALGSILGAILIEDKATSEAVLYGSAGILSSKGLEYSREFEREADAIGFDLLIKSQLNPIGFLGFLEQLSENSAIGVPEYLSTHPLTKNRISYIQSRITALSDNSIAASTSIDYLLLKEKIRGLSYDPSELLAHYEKELKKYSVLVFPDSKIATLYGILNIAILINDTKAGQNAAQQLEKVLPRNPIVARALANHYIRTGNSKTALDFLKMATEVAPGSIPAAEAYGKILVEYNPQTAMQFIRTLNNSMRAHPAILRLESTVWLRNNEVSRSHLAAAKAQMFSGNFNQAKRQLKIAKKGLDKNSTLAKEIDREQKFVDQLIQDIKKLSG